MGNGSRDDGRFRDRDRDREFGQGRGYLERNYRGGRFNDTAGRRYSSFNDRSGYGGENYFGSGRQGYGDGLEDIEPNHAFGSSWRDSTGNSNYENDERRYKSTERRAGFGRDAYGLGYGGDWEPEANRRREANRDLNRNRYEESYASQRDQGRNYPPSESGYYNDRDRDTGDNRSWWDRASDEVSSWFGGGPDDRGRYNEPSYRGRGPKNYTRSDDRIREDINDRLTDHGYLDASDIDVAVEHGEVTLTGTVSSRYQKRMAEDIADDVSGVKNVENRLRVQNQEPNISSATGTADSNTTNTSATETNKGTARGKTTSA
jgi:osmotically-inducible protein OsmY